MQARFCGPRLREARIAAGLRPEQLALHIGRSVYSVHEYERGRVHPSTESVHQIAETLNRPAGWFFGDDTPAEADPAPVVSVVEQRIRDLVESAPPLSEEDCERLAFLLRRPASARGVA